jgi:ferredoxin
MMSRMRQALPGLQGSHVRAVGRAGRRPSAQRDVRPPAGAGAVQRGRVDWRCAIGPLTPSSAGTRHTSTMPGRSTEGFSGSFTHTIGGVPMAYVITPLCERAGLCVDVCPTDSIHFVEGTAIGRFTTSILIRALIAAPAPRSARTRRSSPIWTCPRSTRATSTRTPTSSRRGPGRTWSRSPNRLDAHGACFRPEAGLAVMSIRA